MKSNVKLIFFTGCILLLHTASLQAQQAKSTSKVPLEIRKDANKIIDSNKSLDIFYNKLYQLNQPAVRNNANPSVVSILHIGDSHVQAGFLTVTIMNRLQARFGSAGRGLIFPLKLARTNEPFDYDILSESKWDKTLVVQRTQALPLGLGGLSIKTDDEQFSFEIRSSAREKIDHSFNKITIFHHEKAPELYVTDPAIKSQHQPSPYPFASVIRLDHNVNSLVLSTGQQINKVDSAIYYGFSLENGKSGLLYHSVGINGAQFRHYGSVQNFAQQISILKPELFIFSLGTNEAFRGRLNERSLFNEIDAIIDPIRKANPRALLLIMTPPDCLTANADKSRESNPNIAIVRKVLIRYAEEKGCAYWDLYSILGGNGSANKLYEAGYLSKDGVHFLKGGYNMLGDLFYDALIRNYTDYVQYRLR